MGETSAGSEAGHLVPFPQAAGRPPLQVQPTSDGGPTISSRNSEMGDRRLIDKGHARKDNYPNRGKKASLFGAVLFGPACRRCEVDEALCTPNRERVNHP
jgi:hypothetical protein